MVFESYCIHAQVAFMMLNKDELEQKYNDKKEDVEVLMDKPYYAIAPFSFPLYIYWKVFPHWKTVS